MMKDRDIVRRALENAIDWQQGLADAHDHMRDDPEYARALARVKEYRSLLKRRYGSPQTKAEVRFAHDEGEVKWLGLDELRALALQKAGE